MEQLWNSCSSTVSASSSRKRTGWPRRVSEGRTTVTVYRRSTPSGPGYRVADYSNGTRRFIDFADEQEALARARQIARLLNEGDAIGASFRGEDAAAFTAAIQTLAPFNLPLPVAAEGLAEALRVTGSLANLLQAAEAWARDHKQLIRKPLREVVSAFVELKIKQQASRRYLQDLRSRLGRFGEAIRKDACDVSTVDIQAYLDGVGGSSQTRKNYRTVLHVFFEFALARGFTATNPVAKTQHVSVRSVSEIEIYTPDEFRRLLEASSPDFTPILVLGGFAGLRSAELERVQWENIDLVSGHVTLSARQAKTASRRIVPLCSTAIAWLKPLAKTSGPVWAKEGLDTLYSAQATCAQAAHVNWKKNALRHSYASYRLAEIGDPGRVAAELGNSPAIVHKHYKQLVKPAEAIAWFGIRPDSAASVVAADFTQ